MNSVNMPNIRSRSRTFLFAVTLVAAFSLISATADARTIKDIQYASHPDSPAKLNQLDIYTPEGTGPHPVMVFIHGGSWRYGDKRLVGKKDVFFTERGFVFVSINYRLSPAVTHPAHAEDCGAAVAWVHNYIAQYGGDPNRIYVMGHSSGAHLAALISTDETYLKAAGADLNVIRGTIVLDGGGYDIPTMVNSGELFAQGRYEKAFGASPSTWQNASPIKHVAKGKSIPPFMIVHAGNRVASEVQAFGLRRALEDAGVSVTLFNDPGKNHLTINSDIGTNDDPTTRTIVEFVNKNGANAG